MPNWEYCILTRQTAGLDTKWYVNRVYQHSETALPDEVTAAGFAAHNAYFDELHASKVYPILPAVLNHLGADGWELIDDMATGITGGEGLVFKRQVAGGGAARRSAAKKSSAKKSGAKRAVRR
jgi:hypothetical protein